MIIVYTNNFMLKMSILISIFLVIFSNKYLNNMASYDPSSTSPSSYFNVPNIKSRLAPFKQLGREHRKSEETPSPSTLQQQETTQPIPVSRCKCPGSSNYILRSLIPEWTEPENQTQQRSCLSSFQCKDSLNIIELCYQESSEPQPI